VGKSFGGESKPTAVLYIISVSICGI